MSDHDQTREQLLQEIRALRTRLAALERAAVDREPTEGASPTGGLQFRDIFDHVSGFVGVLTPDGTLVGVNRGALEAGRFCREEVVGRAFWETGWWARSPDVQTELRAAIAEAARGRTVRRESAYFTAAGDERVMDRLLTPVTDRAGRVALIIASGFDVTDRKRAEEALCRAESRFQAMVEYQYGGMALNAADGTVLYLSPSARRLVQFPDGEVVGHSPFEFIHPGDQDRASRALAEVLANPRVPVTIEYRTRHRDEPWRWVEVVARNLLDEPAVGAIVCNYRDVTERKRGEDALRASEARFRGLFDQSAAGMAEADSSGRFVLVNRRYCELVGRPAAELVQLRMQDITHPDDLPGNQELFDRAVRDGPAFDIEKRYVRPDGSHVWVCNSVAPVRGADGVTRSVLAVAVDITARKDTEKALQRARDELEARVRERTVAVEAERARLEEVFRLAPSFMVVFRGPDHVFERANDRYYQLIGRRGIIGRPVREVFPELEGQGYFELLDRVYRTGKPFHGKGLPFLLRRGSGVELDELFLDFVYQPYRGPDGTVSGIIVQGVDLTGHLRTEEARRASEERFARFMRYLPGAAWITDLKGRYLFVNAGFEHAFSRPAKELVGKTNEGLFSEEVAARLRETDRLARCNGGFSGAEILAGVDGARRHWLVRKFAIPGPDDRTALIGGIAMDITEQKRAVKSLCEQAELLDLATDAIIIHNSAGMITYWNRGAEKLYGWAKEDALDRNVHTLLRPAFPVPLADITAAVERSGRWEGELTHTRRDGSPVVVSSRWNRRSGEDGDPAAVLEINTDVTERRQAAEFREQFVGRLIAAQEEERGRVARELHDGVAQVLSALHLRVGALAGMNSIPVAVRDELAELKRVAQAAAEEVRFLARGLRPPVLDELGLLPALARYAEDFGRTHGLRVDVVAGGGREGRLPPEVETALYRIAQEALTNAVRHGGAAAVSIVLLRQPSFVQLLVEDDGTGWDPEVRRADPYTHLGLPSMRERAALLGGSVTVESSPGSGTAVCARLPLEEVV